MASGGRLSRAETAIWSPIAADGARLPRTSRSSRTPATSSRSRQRRGAAGRHAILDQELRKGRPFGLEDEPKYWVRRAIDLEDGSTKILQARVHEKFETTIGEVVIERFRSPRKEARILDLVRGHRNFMHGSLVLDEAGNNVRILEYIRGRRYDASLSISEPITTITSTHFPKVLEEYIELVTAIQFLPRSRGKAWRYQARPHHPGPGNRLQPVDRLRLQLSAWREHVQLRSAGPRQHPDLPGRPRRHPRDRTLPQHPKALQSLTSRDIAITFKNRVANVRKVLSVRAGFLEPDAPAFFRGAKVFYENSGRCSTDLARATTDVVSLTGGNHER